jgi:hypothetical protein
MVVVSQTCWVSKDIRIAYLQALPKGVTSRDDPSLKGTLICTHGWPQTGHQVCLKYEDMPQRFDSPRSIDMSFNLSLTILAVRVLTTSLLCPN